MLRIRYNVVLLTLITVGVIVPGVAVQTRRFRNGTGAPAQKTSCETEPNMASVLEELSWKLYEDEEFGTAVGNVNVSLPNTHSIDHGNTTVEGNLNSVAAARVMRFVQAVKSNQVNVTSDKSVAVVGHKNRSKNEFDDQAGKSAFCCHHVPGNDPYWQETEKYHQTHPGYIKCQYSDGCTRRVTNSMRVKSIRRALLGSRALFQNLGVESLLYGGSAIGQFRCGDVIPWDVDCDFMLKESAIASIHEKVFGSKADFYNWKAGETSIDLASFGAPGIRLIKKTACTPFEIVDTQEGFFCDVFTSKYYSSSLYTPWWNGGHPCPGLFEGCDKAGGGQRCYKFAQQTVTPPQNCVMSGVVQSCPPNMRTYLYTTYGHGWNKPNNTITIGR